jgi:hypothetical protein
MNCVASDFYDYVKNSYAKILNINQFREFHERKEILSLPGRESFV